MSASWEALSARARGLGGHLLDESRLSRLARSASVSDFVRGLADTPYAGHVPAHQAGPSSIEVGLTRSLGERLTTLARWAGPGAEPLSPILLEQDARNVRVILRGALGELSADQRLSGSIPTPMLGRRALEALARAESPRSVAAMLVAWGHPLGHVLLEEARRTRPDMFRLESALAQFLATDAALRAVDRKGAVKRFLTEATDGRNLVTALLLAGSRSERPAAEAFVQGGERLTSGGFVRAAEAVHREEAAEILARETRGSLFESPLKASPATPAALWARILEARIERLKRDGRLDPLSPVPVLLFVLRLRREAVRLRRALWGAALVAGVTP